MISDKEFRDMCAIAALEGLMSREGEHLYREVIKHSFDLADAMLAERIKRDETPCKETQV